MKIKYGAYTLILLASHILSGMYRESLPLLIKTADVAQFEPLFSTFLADTSFSTEARRALIKDCVDLATQTKIAIEQELLHTTGMAVSQAAAGVCMSAYQLLILAPTCLGYAHSTFTRITHPSELLCPAYLTDPRNGKPNSITFPLNVLGKYIHHQKIKPYINTDTVEEHLYWAYPLAISIPVIYGSYLLYTHAQKNMEHVQSLKQKNKNLEAIKQLLESSLLSTNEDIL